MVKDYAAEAVENYTHRKQIELIGGGRRVLDFGCHEGLMAKALTERGCAVTGVEIDLVAAEAARRVCDRVLVGDVEQIDLLAEFSDQQFDVGLFGDILEHLKDPKRVLVRMRQLLAPGGFTVISVPNIAHASIRLMLLQGRFDYADMGILDDTHLKFFTRKSITDLLETCGFVVEVMDWVEAKVSESELHEVLDPLGLANLEEVVKAFSDWEATAYQYIIKAFPASEEDRVRRLSEEKVQVERRVRELEGQVVGLEKRVAEFERVKKWAEDLQEHAESLMVEVDRLRACIKELETVIVEKESRIHALQSTVAKRDRTIADMEGRRG